MTSSWIRKFDTVKIAILLQFIYRLNSIPIRITAVLFVEIDKPILIVIWKWKGLWTAKTVLKNNKAGGLLKLTSKLHNQDCVQWRKDRHREQWDLTESSEVDPYI